MISMTIGAAAGWFGQTLQAVRRGMASHAVLHFFALMVMTLALLESIWLERPINFYTIRLFIPPVVLVLGALIMADLAVQLVRLGRSGHTGSITLQLVHHFVSRQLAPQRIANAIHAVVSFVIFMTGTIYMREAIPFANPYNWDQVFSEWDRVIHFGAYPHEWLAPLLNWPIVSQALGHTYNIWFFVMFAMWFWQGFRKEQTPLRLQFLLAFGLTYFIGCNLLGTLLSSVGPSFYGRLLGTPDPYTPLMDYLRSVSGTSVLGTINTQNLLWQFYMTGEGAARGITAMPSMHVATSVIFALLGQASGKRWLGWILTSFAVLIMIGSVQLGWHYAIDGYFGIAVALFSWWLARKIVEWTGATPVLSNSHPS